jgi:hypothetical protein
MNYLCYVSEIADKTVKSEIERLTTKLLNDESDVVLPVLLAGGSLQLNHCNVIYSLTLHYHNELCGGARPMITTKITKFESSSELISATCELYFSIIPINTRFELNGADIKG